MTLPLEYDYAPMEARSVDELPEGDEWQYEPKWDGFRCLAFKDGATIELRSKAGRSLTRYFPELVESLAALKAPAFVLDGEIVVPHGASFDFDSLLQRIHPAASRIKKLASETPARYIVFDLLVDTRRRDLTEKTLAERRPVLESFMAKYSKNDARAGIVESPVTREPRAAKRWLAGREGLDGVIAKRLDLPYESGERTGMEKVKRIRTADCVVGGFRFAAKGRTLGSLLLGLYDEDGLLNHIGFTSSFTAEEKREVLAKVEKLIKEPGFTGQRPGGPSRWSTKRTSEWEPLATKLVVEVAFDHFSSGRFRHGTTFVRWRPDKKPSQCTMEQVGQAGASAGKMLAGGASGVVKKRRSPAS